MPLSPGSRIVLITTVALVAVAAGYLLAWPTRIDPVAVTVGPNPDFTGPFAPNEALRGLTWLGTAMGRGPEDVWVKDGYAYTGLEDGRVMRVRIDAPAPGTVEKVADTKGRPLGLQHDLSGDLIVADARRGLLAITPAGEITVVADHFESQPLKFADDVDIAIDGTIYFTDASQRFGIDEDDLDFMEGRATGRLFAFDPRTRSLQMKLDSLAFANGVALGPGEAYVLVNETKAHRVTRLWLKGPKAGTRDAFVENLPGYPDNISFNGRDRFWVALVGPRVKVLDETLPFPFRRRVIYRVLSTGLLPTPAPELYGCVIAIDLEGRIVATLQDPGGRVIHTMTSVNERDGRLYFGGLATDRIATLPVPPALMGTVQ